MSKTLHWSPAEILALSERQMAGYLELVLKWNGVEPDGETGGFHDLPPGDETAELPAAVLETLARLRAQGGR